MRSERRTSSIRKLGGLSMMVAATGMIADVVGVFSFLHLHFSMLQMIAVGGGSVLSALAGMLLSTFRQSLGSFLSSKLRRLRRGVQRLNGPVAVADRITGLAALLAGKRRASDADTWRDHLEGYASAAPPGRGWRRTAIALSFVGAALRMRSRDLVNVLCRSLDWVASTHKRFALFTVGSLLIAAVLCYRAGGWARIWDDLQNIEVVVAFTGGAIYGWRRMRGIKIEERGDRLPDDA